jgi:class 3 adenylate cyclase
MNIGLHSGEEWLGTFKSNTHLELVVLGETINTASRLSDFARYGQIWATKRLIDKLQSHDRNHIEYGIQRQGEHPQFIKNTFSLIENLVGHAIETSKLRDIQGVAVAEVIGYKA